MAADIKVETRQGSRCVCVRLTEPLDPFLERHLERYLNKASGVAYVEYTVTLPMRLIGFGVWEPWYEGFRFWLGVSLAKDEEEDYDD
jgi:hypothetical protein